MTGANRSGNALVRHQLFKIGMVGLECLSLAHMSTLYQDGVPQQHLINSLLAKYRRLSQEKSENSGFVDILEQFLQVKEERRINLDDLMDRIFWRGDMPGMGHYQGYSTGLGDDRKPDGVGQVEIQGWTYKGMFVEGKVQGRGIICKSDRYISGDFSGDIDSVENALLLVKNQFVYCGGLQKMQDFQRHGAGV